METPSGDRPFLTAHWQFLLMLNYAVEPALLADLVPFGTEIDTWHGDTLVSLVGFRFLDTRVLGFPIPGHRDFDEINLRFYVRRRDHAGAWRRGVVFVREIVPKRLVALVARWIYDEPYVTRPMRHQVDPLAMMTGAPFTVEYAWYERGRWNALGGAGRGTAAEFAMGSEAEFITEHYWGYTKLGATSTTEYEVVHPPWRVWTLEGARFDGEAAGLYGADLADVISGTPRSAFLALGSDVVVYHGTPVVEEAPDWPAA